MTDILCYADGYMREFEATVTPKGVALDRTAFYPGGGGQPSDSGALVVGDAEYRVKKLSRQGGALAHELDAAPDEMPAVGAAALGTLEHVILACLPIYQKSSTR